MPGRGHHHHHQHHQQQQEKEKDHPEDKPRPQQEAADSPQVAHQHQNAPGPARRPPENRWAEYWDMVVTFVIFALSFNLVYFIAWQAGIISTGSAAFNVVNSALKAMVIGCIIIFCSGGFPNQRRGH